MTRRAGARVIGALCTALLVVVVMAPPAAATLVVYDAFPYAGNLVNIPPNTPDIGGAWAAHSGAGANPIQVTSNKAVLQQGAGSREDANTTFAGGEVAGTGEKFYAGLDLVVTGGNSDVYFAHFKDISTLFRSRVFVTSFTGADYTIGFSDTATLAQTWATGLTFGTSYRVVISYTFDSGVSELWVNPTQEGDTKLTVNGTAGTAILAFALRQATPTGTSTQTIDNLKVGTTFNEVLGTAAPTGACCDGENCSITTPANCTSPKVWQGADTTCAPTNPCLIPRGACCFGATCSITKEVDCVGGLWKGANTVCSPSPCTGACCYLVGATPTCTMELLADCTNVRGGTWYAGQACSGFTCPTIPSGPIINELDADTLGADTAEFIELYGTPNQSLNGYIVVLYTTTGYQAYLTIPLNGYNMRADGYFVIGSTGMGSDIEISPGTAGWLRNGPHAAALHYAPPDPTTKFSIGTPVTTAYLVDAIVYGTGQAADPVLLLLLNVWEPQVNENQNFRGTIQSNQRCPDGSGGARNTTTYAPWLPTAGAANICLIRGACCVSGNCSIMFPADCTAAGGTYLGDESACGRVTCACMTAAGVKAQQALQGGSGVVTCNVVVSTTTDLVASSASKSFNVQDATGGITVFGPNVLIDDLLANGGNPVVEGSTIQISGTTTDFAGLLELESTAPLPLRIISTTPGAPPAPVEVQVADLLDGSTTAEALESKLVKLTGVTFVETGVFSGATNYTVYAGSSPPPTASVRIATNDLGDIISKPIPTWKVNIIGVFSQYDTTPPYDGGYQLLPRRWTDFELCTLLGDVNQNGVVNGLDIAGFVRAKLGEDPLPGENQICANFGTGTLEGDIAAFTARLVSP